MGEGDVKPEEKRKYEIVNVHRSLVAITPVQSDPILHVVWDGSSELYLDAETQCLNVISVMTLLVMSFIFT